MLRCQFIGLVCVFKHSNHYNHFSQIMELLAKWSLFYYFLKQGMFRFFLRTLLFDDIINYPVTLRSCLQWWSIKKTLLVGRHKVSNNSVLKISLGNNKKLEELLILIHHFLLLWLSKSFDAFFLHCKYSTYWSEYVSYFLFQTISIFHRVILSRFRINYKLKCERDILGNF